MELPHAPRDFYKPGIGGYYNKKVTLPITNKIYDEKLIRKEVLWWAMGDFNKKEEGSLSSLTKFGKQHMFYDSLIE